MSSSTVSTSAKRYAARKAVDLFVRSPNMRIGLGSGSTVVFVAEALKKLSVDSASVATCVPTSYQSRELIIFNRLPLCDLDQNENCQLDVTIDGADEVIKCGSGFVAIKGGGGCLLQEKVIAAAAHSLVLVIRSNKMSEHLGQNWSRGVPIEVLPMAQGLVSRKITELFGGTCSLRMASEKMGPVVTDNGNFLLDWKFPHPMPSLDNLALNSTTSYTNGHCGLQADCKMWQLIDEKLHAIPGLIETGLFVDMAKAVVISDDDGNTRVEYRGNQQL